MDSQKNFYLVALGCPKNLVDSEIISGNLLTSGWSLAMTPEDAQLYIINTCAFIESATQEAINTIIEIGQLKTEGSLKYLIVAGCLAQNRSRMRTVPRERVAGMIT